MNNVKKLFSGWFLVVFLTAVLAQILLGVFSPDSRGYAYDYYSRAILVVLSEGRMPNYTDCWICYHPPLFPMVGAAIFKFVELFGLGVVGGQYAVSAMISFLSLVMAVYGFLLYQRFRKNEKLDLIMWALWLFLPVRFISSFSVEADVFAATLIVMATYYFSIYWENNAMRMLLLTAFLLGLACLTKYNGLVVVLFFGLLLFIRFVRARNFATFKHGFIYGLVVFVVGGWLYAANYIKYDKPFPGNAAWNTGERYWDAYDFTTFGIGRIVAAFYREPPGREGELRHFSAFNNEVLTSHYGQLWTDFSFFSVQDRHGMHEFRIYFRGKITPKKLIWAILIAGLIPVAYGLIGFCLTLWQRQALLLTGLFLVTIAAYLNWFTGYHIWMLKTKYLLYLLPIWLIYVSKFADVVGTRVFTWTMSPAVILSVIYCFVFAIG